MANEDMVWIYSGWSDVRCPFCEGAMADTGSGPRCTSCDWPNDRTKLEPTITEIIAAKNLQHRVIPAPGAVTMRLPGIEEVAQQRRVEL